MVQVEKNVAIVFRYASIQIYFGHQITHVSRELLVRVELCILSAFPNPSHKYRLRWLGGEERSGVWIPWMRTREAKH